MLVPMPIRREIKALSVLSAPLVVAQLAQMMMGVVGTVVAGHIGVHQLAAQALGATTFAFVLMSGYGAMSGLDPHVSKAVGQGDLALAGRILRQGLWMAVIIGVPLTVLLWYSPWVLRAMGQDSQLLVEVEQYLHAAAPGLLPALAYAGYRSFASAVGRPGIIMGGAVIANIVHAVLCAGLAKGLWGLPNLGVGGIGLASVVCRIILVGIVAIYIRQSKAFSAYRALFDLPSWPMLKRLLRSGLPLGLQYGLEVTGFVLITLWMGLLGAQALAAHEVAMTVAALGFQVPFSVGTAAAMRVGHAVGRRDAAAVARAGWTALAVGVVFSVISGILMLIGRDAIAKIYLPDASPEVWTMAAHFLTIAAGFQLADGTQAIGFGVLRGLDDTRVPMWFNVLGFGLLGLPVAYVGAFVLRLGPDPLWWGLTIALFVVSTSLALRFYWILGRPSRVIGPAISASQAPVAAVHTLG